MDSPQRILESLKEARSVSSNGRALVGLAVIGVMRDAGVNLTVIKEVQMERGGVRITEVEIALDNLPDSIPAPAVVPAAGEPAAPAAEQTADTVDVADPVDASADTVDQSDLIDQAAVPV